MDPLFATSDHHLRKGYIIQELEESWHLSPEPLRFARPQNVSSNLIMDATIPKPVSRTRAPGNATCQSNSIPRIIQLYNIKRLGHMSVKPAPKNLREPRRKTRGAAVQMKEAQPLIIDLISDGG